VGQAGKWWTPLIVHDAFDGCARFDQFQGGSLGISSSILLTRLKTLVADGLEQSQTSPSPSGSSGPQ
jgi:DNA-binding HxlR family transcriptional regulator